MMISPQSDALANFGARRIAAHARPLLRAGYGNAVLRRPKGTQAHSETLQSFSLLAADIGAGAISLAIAATTAALLSTSDEAGLAALTPWLLCIFAGLAAHFATHGHYTRRLSRWTEFQRLVSAAAGALLATALVAYLTQNERAQLPVLFAWATFPLAVLASRTVARVALRAAGRWDVPVVIVGNSDNAAAATETLMAAPHLGYRIRAYVTPGDLPLLLTTNGWQGILKRHAAQMVVLAYDEDDANRPAPHMIEALVRERVPVAMLRKTHGLPSLGCEQTAFIGHEAMMLCYATARDKKVARAAKAALDVSVAAVALLFLAPLLAMIAAFVKLDGGPAFFAHARIGHGGRTFHCLKFRTMVQDSAAVLERVLAEDPAAAREWEETQKLRNDPRVTWIGRILRKTSLDELPQLFNVLRLEMSLVGPRPIVSREITRYADDIAYYYETRPGITGLWQVSGRNNTTYARRVELDRWYVKNWSFGQDFSILLRTLPAVLSGHGAS